MRGVDRVVRGVWFGVQARGALCQALLVSGLNSATLRGDEELLQEPQPAIVIASLEFNSPVQGPKPAPKQKRPVRPARNHEPAQGPQGRSQVEWYTYVATNGNPDAGVVFEFPLNYLKTWNLVDPKSAMLVKPTLGSPASLFHTSRHHTRQCP